MTEENNVSIALSDETPERYIAEKQAEYLGLLNRCFDAKDITEEFYEFARFQRCEETDWDSVFEYFTQLNEGLVEQIQNKAKYFLIERIDKGIAYMHRDDITTEQRRGAERLLDQLSKELEAMMQ